MNKQSAIKERNGQLLGKQKPSQLARAEIYEANGTISLSIQHSPLPPQSHRKKQAPT